MNIVIIGGGISGISAAKVALGEKHDVTILESTPEPGGLMARIANCRVGFKTFFDEIRDNEKLSVISDAKVAKVDKTDKTWTVTLDDGRALTADRVIIATGLTPYDPVEYKGKRVLTSLEYDAVIDQRQGELPADFNKIGFSFALDPVQRITLSVPQSAAHIRCVRSSGRSREQSRRLLSFITISGFLVRSFTWRRLTGIPV